MTQRSTPVTPFFAELRSLVIVPTLQKMAVYVPALDGPAARNLLLGTVAQESGGKFLAQWPSGPGAGLWEIEPATHDDLLKNTLAYMPALQALTGSMLSAAFDAHFQLISNLHYGCAIARLLYYRVRERLPAADDVQGLARYWKTYFNTAAGAGTVDQFVTNFRNLIGEPPDV